MLGRVTTNEVPESLDARALAARLGVSTRTLRSWTTAGVLPQPEGTGAAARYGRALIVRAHAIAALRRDGVPLDRIARFLGRKSEALLRELGGLPPLPRKRGTPALPAPRTPRALPSGGTSSGAEEARRREQPGDDELVAPSVVPRAESLAVQGSITTHEDDAGGAGAPVGSEWRRIELLPGLELHVRADASPFVHGLAAAIAAGRFPK